MNRKEAPGPQKERKLITHRGMESMQLRLVELREQMRQAKLDTAAGGGGDWHENFAFEDANNRVDVLSSQIAGIERELKEAEILNPRMETDVVGVGNTVVVKYQGEEDVEKYTILSSSDVKVLEGCISSESPLGKALVGRAKGVTVIVGDRDKFVVKLMDILPGEF